MSYHFLHSMLWIDQEYFLADAQTSWTFDETKISKEKAATVPIMLCVPGDGLYIRVDPLLYFPWEDKKSDWRF